jgi:hypothetical protein
MKGQIKIRLGNESQEPCVVYISGKSLLDLWVCEVLNTGNTVFSKDEQLIDFDYKEFKRISYSWKIEQQDRIKERYKKLLEEIK